MGFDVGKDDDKYNGLQVGLLLLKTFWDGLNEGFLEGDNL